MKHKAVVKSVEPYSIAFDAGIEPGDVIEKISGKEFRDILDFKFLTSDEYYTVEVTKADGSIEEIEIYNDCYETFGAEFENPLIDKPMLCKNKCIFCFMDQLPPNVRSTMLFKDDDVRLSFLQGNYVTLTNLSQDDIERICSLRISPINVSIHVTDPERRVMMLANPNAANVMSIMRRFADAGIVMNGQIVLCPDINDGEYLMRTISDLGSLYPAMRSVSIVPVGLSKYRKSLYELKGFTPETAAKVIADVTPLQEQMKQTLGTSLVYLADEFYIQAGVAIPPYEHYEEFPQIENGVGLVAAMRDEIDTELSYISDYAHLSPSPKTIATSVIAHDFICECVERIKALRPDADVNVQMVTNGFFGDRITVTGLLCGSDIIEQLKGKINTKYLLLSESMFKADCDIFLDDTTLEDVEKALGVKVIKTPNTGAGFIKAILS